MEFGLVRAMLCWDIFPCLTWQSDFLAHFPQQQLLIGPVSVWVDVLSTSSVCLQMATISVYILSSPSHDVTVNVDAKTLLQHKLSLFWGERTPRHKGRGMRGRGGPARGGVRWSEEWRGDGKGRRWRRDVNSRRWEFAVLLQGRKCSGIGKEAFSQCATLSSEVQSQGKGKTGDRQERDRSKRLKGEERGNTFPPQVTTDIIRFKLICCLIG